MAGVDRYETVFAVRAKSARVSFIYNRAAGEDHHAAFFGKSDGQLIPMQKVAAHCMSPAHVSPFITERVVLEKEMVLAFEVDEAVRVVGPVFAR